MGKAVCIWILILCFALSGCTKAAAELPAQTTSAMAESVPEETLPPETEAAATEQTESAPTESTADTGVTAYYQTDYPYLRYGNGTIGSSGCSITCLAMAATYVTGQTYTPDMMAREFGSYGRTNIERLEYAVEQMQLPCEKNTDWQITKQALQDGKIAIALMDERSQFTTSAHFVLLTGINEAGRYEVIDPFRPNYDNDFLKEGFEKGFTEGNILAGLEGSWVFDKEAMGSFRYPIEEPERIPTRYSGFEPGDKEIDYLSRFVWAAAREESLEVQQAVAELVLNRMVSDKYPDLVEDVMRQEELYRWYKEMHLVEEPEIEQYIAVNGAFYGPYVLPIDVVHGAPWPVGGGEEWGKIGSFIFSYERE